MKKIGIYGGTFDPVHNGHIMLAKAAMESFYLDEVYFVPAGHPYFKTECRVITLGAWRKKMLELAVSGHRHFLVSDVELKREGITYTADTLLEFKKTFPEDELYFIMGADSFAFISSWHDPETIFRTAKCIVATRNGQVSEKNLSDEASRLKKTYGADIRLLSWEGRDISSSDIRLAASKGRYDLDVPEKVAGFIKKTGLYLENPDVSQLKYRLKALLKPSRFSHSLGVAETAVDLALCHGFADTNKAYLAGLLHDCGKPFADALTHAAMGAEIAEKYFCIKDPEILSAIKCHTIGRIDMSLLDKIIFTADFIEPTREGFPGLKQIRKESYLDLNKAMLMCMESTAQYLETTGRHIDEESLKVYTYYKELFTEE